MIQKEIRLFKELCKFKDNELDESLLEYATPEVLGHLFFNRMQGISYDTMKEKGMLGKVNREFRNSLAAAYEQNIYKNRSFIKCVEMVSDILSKCESKVALLKGAFLCPYYIIAAQSVTDNFLSVLWFKKRPTRRHIPLL